MTEPASRTSIWTPLRTPVFAALWFAGLASDFGAWMHEVGEAWLMTSLTPSPFSVALLQAADSLAVFLLAIPAGALADVMDRRRLAIVTQLWLLAGALALGLLTLTHRMTPAALVGLTFAMGVGAALDTPLWQAIVAEVVPRSELPNAVTLGGLSLNVARAFGPALGGLLVAAAGPFAVFFVNAVTFGLVAVVLFRWRRVQPRTAAPAERWLGALRGGVRYARHSADLRAAFARAAATLLGAVALMALLPSLARRTMNLGSLGFGVLLGCLGAGAVIAAVSLPKLAEKTSADTTLSIGTIALGVCLGLVAAAPTPPIAAGAMLLAGVAWMTVISSLNVAVQVATPSWVRARVSSVFMLVFQGAFVLGALVWGALATQTSVRVALACAGAATIASVLARAWFPLGRSTPDFSPAIWPKPQLVCEPPEDAGPVLVTITYRVEEAQVAPFVAAMHELEPIRRRGGAYDWGLYRDGATADVFIEVYSVDSWADHLRQHERVTADERAAEERARALAARGSELRVQHLISVSSDGVETTGGGEPQPS